MDKINLKELDLTKFVNLEHIYLIFIGEIYNYRQISPDFKSDYESIIQAKTIPGIRPVLLGKLAKNADGEYEIIKRKL